MKRVLEREWLDDLPVNDPGAMGSRRDLQQLNRIMDHGTVLHGLLESGLRGRTPRRIAELGGGDGTMLLNLAGRLSRHWPRVDVVLVDSRNTVTDEIQSGFSALGWRVEVVTADVCDWLRKPEELADAMFCNLFLHHFSETQLAELLRLASNRTRLLAACEPRRAVLPLVFSRMVGLIGCNAVTRHDAPASVRAGFAGRELTRLWPARLEWRLREFRAGWFSHAFLADSYLATDE